MGLYGRWQVVYYRKWLVSEVTLCIVCAIYYNLRNQQTEIYQPPYVIDGKVPVRRNLAYCFIDFFTIAQCIRKCVLIFARNVSHWWCAYWFAWVCSNTHFQPFSQLYLQSIRTVASLLKIDAVPAQVCLTSSVISQRKHYFTYLGWLGYAWQTQVNNHN